MIKKYDLEERLIDFAVLISDVIDSLPKTKLGNYLSGQMIRSGTSPALHYGEAQSAESRKDFLHKMKIILKELRESFICLTIMHKSNLCEVDQPILNSLQAPSSMPILAMHLCEKSIFARPKFLTLISPDQSSRLLILLTPGWKMLILDIPI